MELEAALDPLLISSNSYVRRSNKELRGLNLSLSSSSLLYILMI